MSKVSLTKGGKIVTGGKSAGTYSYNKGTKSYEKTSGTGAVTPKSGGGDTAIQTAPIVPPKTEPILITSGQGERVVDQTQKRLDTIKGTTVTPEEKTQMQAQLQEAQTKLDEYIKNTKPAETTKPQQDESVTYINPETGQEAVLKGGAVTEENKKKYESQGYQPTETTTSAGAPTAIETARGEMTAAATELNNTLGQLTETAISSKELAAKTRSIRQRYNARIDAMQTINERRHESMNTLGIRLGSRYTGSAGGTMGSILSEEERQGIERIVGIESDMQTAILDAEDAARNYNFTLYQDLATKAQNKYTEKVTAFKELEAAQKTEDEKIAAEKTLIENQTSVIAEIQAGEKDPMAIFAALGGKVPFDDIKKITDTLPKPPEAFTLSEGQARYDAEGKLIASRAKTYAPKAVPIPGNMTPGQVSAFNSIVGKYNASPLIQAADRTVVLENSIKEARNNPGDGAQQLNLVYSYVQALDTYQSAVREGELALVNSIDSKVGKLSNFITQVQDGQIVRPEVANEIANAAENLVGTIKDGAKKKAKSFESQANTVGLGTQWQQYTSGFTQSYESAIDYSTQNNDELLSGQTESGESIEDPNGIYTQ